MIPIDNFESNKTLKLIINDQLDVFAKICELTPNTILLLKESLCLLTEESLNQTVKQTYSGLSKINSNGFPFQWSLNLGNNSPSVRFLCEVGHPGNSSFDRANLSLKKVSQLTDLLSFGYPEWLFSFVIPRVLPTRFPDHWLSAVWYAMGANNKGILPKIYFNLNQGKMLDRWMLIGWIMKDLNRELSLKALCEMSRIASEGSLPFGVAFDIMPDGSLGRIKVYFKSMKGNIKFIERWYRASNALYYSPKIRDFLDCFPNDSKYPFDSFIMGVEFPPENTKHWNPTLKLDLGITKWIKGDSQIRDGILRALGLLNIPTEYYRRFLDELGPPNLSNEACIFHRFVGLGYEADESIHINTYFEPFVDNSLLSESSINDDFPSKNQVFYSNDKINKAIDNALLFLEKSQKSNGSWIDFQLPVGESDIWVTAYVLYQLNSLQGNTSQYNYFKKCRRKALNWLKISSTQTGGWSYNSVVEEDSDSTSLAILAIRSMNELVPERSLDRLLLYFDSCGGVSTYLEDVEEGRAWSTSQCDVTPLALLALNNKLSPTMKHQALKFLLKHQRSNGLWPSFWWISPLYATNVVLNYLSSNQYNIPNENVLFHTLDHFYPSGEFEKALHLNCIATLRGNDISKYSHEIFNLLKSQLPNGAWPSSPILRLTNPDIEKPWMKIDVGPVYTDIRNIFTTATVIKLLSNISNKNR